MYFKNTHIQNFIQCTVIAYAFCIWTGSMPNAYALDVEQLQQQPHQVVGNEAIANVWDLTQNEYSDYLKLIKQGYAAYFWKDLDPVMVLGLSSQSNVERAHYAEKYARLMRQRVKQELAWENAYQAADKKVFPLEQQVFDRTKLYGKEHPDITSALIEGDKITVFTQASCQSCISSIKKMAAAMVKTHTVSMDIYFVDAVDDQSILSWAKAAQLPRQLFKFRRVTLNQGQPYTNKVKQNNVEAVIERNGQFYDLDTSSFS